MAQRTYLDLVDVEFKDLTNHEQTPDRSDIMGIILSYPWGPVEKPILYDKESFFVQYPESLPADMSPKSQYLSVRGGDEYVPIFTAHQFDAWLQCKQFFANGGRQVEVLNTLGSKRYVGGFTDNGLTFQGSSDTRLLKGKYFLGLVYPGLPTADHVGFNHIGLQLRVTTPSATSDRCTIEVVAYTGGTADDPKGDIVVESFQGQWYDEGKLQQGQFTHFVHVLKRSKFIRCYNTEDMDFTAFAGSFESQTGYSGIFVPASYETDPGNPGNIARVSIIFKGSAQDGATYDSSICSMLAQDPTTAAAIKDPNLCKSVVDRNASYAYKYLKYFGNIDKTHATIVVGPVSAEFSETNLIAKVFHGTTSAGDAILAYNKVLMGIAEYCMTRMAFVPMYSQVSSGNIVPWVHDDLAQAIYGPSAGADTILPKFTNLIQGYEQVTFDGVKYPLDCCGGVAGAYANIAKTVRVNQVASARTYGAYKGRLLNDPEFDDVLDNHDSGIITVYNGAAGPEIFGVHNAGYLEDPNSYFATNNVSRTLTWILRDLFPLILGAIHTDASANPTSRSILNDRCNDIVDNYIAEENLLGDSYFDVPNEANSDAKNNKGRLLTCVLACHFIGLVERINFKIVATDSTVTVEIA